MKKLVLDIETNSQANHIWCCVTEDVDTGEVICHTEPHSLEPLIAEYDKIIGHNLIGFDAPKLKEHWNVGIRRSQVVDTLIMSRLLSPVLEGGHSLRAWGVRLGGQGKIDFEDYDGGLTEEMITYCKQDVHLTVRLYNHLNEHFARWRDAETSIALEHNVAIECHKQERSGFKLDIPKAQVLHATVMDRMSAIEDQMQAIFPPIVEERWSEKTGKRLKDKVTDFNVGSRKQIAERLQSLGWKPEKFTETGQPIVDETTLEDVDIKEAKVIAEFLMLQKRAGLLASWLKEVGEDGRIHGRINTLGTITGRMSHNRPNLGQVPSVNKPFGKECRELFTVEDGNVLCGIDLSGIELRCLAHYMQDDDWTEELLNGDIHTKNAEAAGIDRPKAKTMVYATLYGCGIGKLATILDCSDKEARVVLDNFYKNTPKLRDLLEKVKRIASKGYVPSLTGGRIQVRSEHSALNTLLQGCGATIAKQWCVTAHKNLRYAKIPAKQVAIVHDEIQIEVPKQYAEQVAEIMVASAKEAGEILDFRVPVDAEAKIGLNWYDTH